MWLVTGNLRASVIVSHALALPQAAVRGRSLWNRRGITSLNSEPCVKRRVAAFASRCLTRFQPREAGRPAGFAKESDAVKVGWTLDAVDDV